MAAKLKKDFIKLLEKDAEFRYAVAGYIGLADISKSLSKMAEHHAKAEEWLTRADLRRRFVSFLASSPNRNAGVYVPVFTSSLYFTSSWRCCSKLNAARS